MAGMAPWMRGIMGPCNPDLYGRPGHDFKAAWHLALRNTTRRPMLIYLDTEFSDFEDPRLISVGLVAEDAYRFLYGELDRRGWYRYASEFVLANVVPLLETPFGSEGPAQLAARIDTWASRLPSECTIACDSDYDWILLRRLMLEHGRWPDRFASRYVRVPFTEESEQLAALYHLRAGTQPHHALHDARALRFAHLNRSN